MKTKLRLKKITRTTATTTQNSGLFLLNYRNLEVNILSLTFQHNICLHNKIYSFCNSDNIHVHTDTTNSTSAGNKQWQYTLTSYHEHVPMSAVKQYWNIESPDTTSPQST